MASEDPQSAPYPKPLLASLLILSTFFYTQLYAQPATATPYFNPDYNQIQWLGCDPVPIIIDTTKAPSWVETSKVVKAVRTISQITGWEYPLNLKNSKTIVVSWKDEVGGAYIWGDGIKKGIVYDTNVQSENYYGVILHELLHLAGLDHTDYPGSVMGKNGGNRLGVPDLVGLQFVGRWRTKMCNI